MKKEEFESILIEAAERFHTMPSEDEKSAQALEGWKGSVPSLHIWSFTASESFLNSEQRKFLTYFKQQANAGNWLKGFYMDSYARVYANDLVKKIKSRNILQENKERLLNLLASLNIEYNISDSDIQTLLKNAVDSRRGRRLKAKNKADDAQWISPGQTVEVGDHRFTRGAFFLGQKLHYSSYNAKEGKFSTFRYLVEGPVVDLVNEISQDRLVLTARPSTYVELDPQTRQDLLRWLSGESIHNENALAYYFSGIEIKLLAMPSTTQSERAEILQYLHSLLLDDTIWEKRGFRIKKSVFNLVDWTLTLFFIDEAEAVLPAAFVQTLPQLNLMRKKKDMESMLQQGVSAETALSKTIKGIFPPALLPEVYVEAFQKKMQSEALFYYKTNFRSYFQDESLNNYSAIVTASYGPVDSLRSTLKQEGNAFDKNIEKMYRAITTAYSYVNRLLGKFLELREKGHSVIAQVLELPSWCDPSLLPGLDEAIANISPAENENLKVVTLKELLKTLSLPHYDTGKVEKDLEEQLICDLSRLGLGIGCNIAEGPALDMGDTVAIYRKIEGRVPNRGTVQTAMVLMSWIIQADGQTEADLRQIDDWLRTTNAKANFIVAAQAVMRWLPSHKITMTAKRKERAKRLKRFPKKLDELMAILLRLVHKDDTVSPKRMKRLETLYGLLDLDPKNIHSDIHRMVTAGSGLGTAPAKQVKAMALDKNKIKEMQRNTLEAQKILADVFSEAQSTDEASTTKKKKSAKGTDPVVALIKKLLKKPEWTRSEFETMCQKAGQTPGALLEKINDLAYELLDEPVVEEDGDTICVDQEVATPLLKTI